MEPKLESNQTISRFERLLVALVRAEVEFILVGGLAVILNGYGRLTEDMDILVADSPGNLDRLLATLRNWGEGWARELAPEDFVPQEGSIRISEEEFDLDIFTRMRGRAFDDFAKNALHFDAQGVRIRYLAPEDLIFLKGGSWRDKDQLDVSAMKEVIRRRQQS